MGTNLPSNAPVNPHRITLRHLMEGEAHLADSSMLGLAMAAGVPTDIVTEIINELAHDDVYTYAKIVFLELTKGRYRHGPFVGQLVAAINLALSPGIYRREANLVEDVYPSWRYVRICEALASLDIPQDPLENYLEFGEVVSTALDWMPPHEMMEQHADDSTYEDFDDDIMRDMFDRHRFFCGYVLSTGALPFMPFSGSDEYFARLEPWVLLAGGRFLFKNYPKEIGIEKAGFTLMENVLGEDLLFASDFSEARKFHRRMHSHLLKRAEWTEERLDFEFQEYMDSMITNHGKVTVAAATDR